MDSLPLISDSPLRSARARSLRRRRNRSRRAVAEVVATIILLALTVVLFSAIFAFVTSFPSPPAQSNNQFQANLGYTVAKNGTTYITTVSIIHLAGPAVPSTGLVYVKSAAHPTAAQFQNPYTLADGGLASGAQWNLGQTWSIAFPTGVASLPDNLTVYVVSSTSVLFSVILPGQSFVSPPTFVGTAVSPSSPSVGASFNITATIAGSVKSNSVYVNLAGVPGLTATAEQLKYSAASGQYFLLVTSSYGATTTSGTYYAFLNASGSNGQSSTTAIAITITSTGSKSTPVFSVSTLLVPSTSTAFPSGQEAQSNVETAAALITYTGTSTTTVSVNFYVNGTSGGRGWSAANYEWASSGTPVTITGPTSVTIYSNAVWTVPSNTSAFTYELSALASGTAGVGQATGVYPFSPVLGGVWGWNCGKTNGCTTGFYNHAASTCTNSTGGTGTCPIFFATVWDNSTNSGTYSLNLYLNSTTKNILKVTSSGSITAGTPVTAKASIAWAPTKNTVYTVTLVATVTTSIGTGTLTFAWGYYTTT